MKTKLFLAGIAFIGAMVFAQMAYAQDAQEGKSNAVTLDVMPFLKGLIATDSDTKSLYFNLFSLAYERKIFSHYSIGGAVDLWFGKFPGSMNFTYFSMVAHGRWYPLAEFDKLFIDVGLGFNLLRSNAAASEFTGLVTGLKAGWKHYFIPAFYVEPSIAYVYSKSAAGTAVVPLGWQSGLIAGFAF